MCVERVHRFLMAIVIAIGVVLVQNIHPYGSYIHWFVVGMLIVYGITNFCPSVTIMKKLGLRSCHDKKK